MSGPNAPPVSGRGMNFPSGLPSDMANYTGGPTSMQPPRKVNYMPPQRAAQAPPQAPVMARGPSPSPAPGPRPVPTAPVRATTQAATPDLGPNDPSPLDTAPYPAGPVGAPSDARLDMLRGAMRDAIMRRGNIDTMRFPQNMPKAGEPYDPTTGEATGGGASSIPKSTGPTTILSPGDPRAASLLAQEMAKVQMQKTLRPDQMRFRNEQPAPADNPSGNPRAVPKDWYTKMARTNTPEGTMPPVRATAPNPIVQRFLTMWQQGKLDKYNMPHIPEKTDVNKKAKDSSEYIYKALGVQIGDKRGLTSAINKLQKKAVEKPWELTPVEDQILAMSGRTEGANRSMEPAAVQERMAANQAKKGELGMDLPEMISQPGVSSMRPKFDPAETLVQQYILQGAAPQWEGKPNAPTQRDVQQAPQAPQQFKQQFPTYAPPSAQADQTETDNSVADEEND